MKINGCKFLPDCSPKPKLFPFQHMALALSAWVPTVLNTTSLCCCAHVNVFIPVKHCKSGPELVHIFWQLTCCTFVMVLEEGIIEWLDKVGIHAVNKVVWVLIDECSLQGLLEKKFSFGIVDDGFWGLVMGVCLASRRWVAVAVSVLVVAHYVQNISPKLVRVLLTVFYGPEHMLLDAAGFVWQLGVPGFSL